MLYGLVDRDALSLSSATPRAKRERADALHGGAAASQRSPTTTNSGRSHHDRPTRRQGGRHHRLDAQHRSRHRRSLRGRGRKVVINGRSDEKGQSGAGRDERRRLGGFYQGSATDQQPSRASSTSPIDHFGQLDIMVLNAGGVGQSAPIMEMSDEEWQYELDLNLNHTFWGTRKALQHMVPRGWGRIIALSSVEGKHGKPNVAGYTANKHAINGFVKSVSREVGVHGVTVNAICPGLVVTDMLYEKAGPGARRRRRRRR